MAHVSGSHRRGYRRLSGRPSAQVPAALHHLRLGGRRQVYPDRPPPLRLQDDLRGSACRPGGRLQARRNPGRGNRLRPAGGRTGGGARTGHHHRCRLSVLFHGQAQVHRRRHAGARTVYPKHGHRRLDGRSGGHSDRRAQGRAHPDPPAQLPGAAHRHPPCGPGGEQDGSGELRPGGVRRASSPTTGPSPPRSASTAWWPFPLSGLRGDNITSLSDRTPWYRGRLPDATTWRPSRSTRTACAPAPCACRCSGSTAPISISAASAARSPRASRGRATR